MFKLRSLTLTLLLAVIACPAWSTLYRIPGTLLTVEIRNQDPAIQFTPSEIQMMLSALSRFPVSQLKVIKYIEAMPSNNCCVTIDSAGGIIINFANTTAEAEELRRLQVGVGLLVYRNYLSPSDQAAWNAMPERTATPIDDFAVYYYSAWYQNSFGNLSQTVSTLRTTGDSAPSESLLFAASLFFNTKTGMITVHCEDATQCQKLGSTQLTTIVTENSLQLANYTIQVRQSQNQTDPNFEMFEVTSIQQTGQDPIVLSANSFMLPSAFATQLQQLVSTPLSTSVESGVVSRTSPRARVRRAVEE